MKNLIRGGCLLVLSVTGMAACNPKQENQDTEKETAKATLLSDQRNKASTVYLTTDEKDNPIVSWTEEDSAGKKRFYFARWDTTADKFMPAGEIPLAQNAAIHEEGMPKIAVRGDGALVAIYEASTPQPGQKWGVGDIFYLQSDDGGDTWTEPKSVNTQKQPYTSMSFSGLTRLSDGEIGISWLDANPGGVDQPGRPVMFARTLAGGGLGDPVWIEKAACECCRVAVAGSGNGDIAIAYRDLQPGNIRDISISTSSDDGKTFARPLDFSRDGWEINGCPHNGPSLAAGNDKICAAWYTGGKVPGVHYAALDFRGNLIEKKALNPNARFVQLTLMPDGTPIVAFNESYKEGDSVYSRIVLNKIEEGGLFAAKINSPGLHGNFPMVQPVDENNVLLAWRDGDKIYYQLNRLADINRQMEEPPQLPEATSLKEMHGMNH